MFVGSGFGVGAWAAVFASELAGPRRSGGPCSFGGVWVMFMRVKFGICPCGVDFGSIQLGWVVVHR